MKSVALLFFLLAVVGLSQADVDYCSKSLCQSDENHIACKHSGDFAKTCPKDRKMIKLDAALQKVIVDLHNTLRNDVAEGKVSGFKEATKMASMTWNPELASLAELLVKDCTFDHDECHDTPTFKMSGQNLAQTWYSGSVPTDTEVLDELIRSWFDEHKDANMDVIAKYPEDWDKDEIGHFTAMINEGNTDIGCGFGWFIDDMDTKFLVCNYARTNIIDRPVYEAGAAATKCKTGTHPDYKFLCSPKEVYKMQI